jgi:energy-coupling factor transporter transmembrane protein EcfT
VSARPDRWNPLTPLAVALLLVAGAYTGPAPWSAAGALGIALGAAWWSGAGRRVTTLAAAVAIPTFALLALTNGVLAAEHATAVLGGVRYDPDGVRDALAVSLRLGAAVAALGTFIAGVAPRRLTRALAARGMPGWAAYLIVASLEAAPEAKARAREVLDAQRCRGMSMGGGPLGRLRSLAPLVGPLVASLVTESDESALALDARGFVPGRRRTALTPIADPSGERALRMLLWAAIIALLAWGALR